MENLLKLAPPAHILKFSSYYAGHTLNLTSAELNTHYVLLCKQFCIIPADHTLNLTYYVLLCKQFCIIPLMTKQNSYANIMTQNQDTGGWIKEMSNRERGE